MMVARAILSISAVAAVLAKIATAQVAHKISGIAQEVGAREFAVIVKEQQQSAGQNRWADSALA
jgi:hypothetical protein